jgi:hypothetical protein
MGDLRRGIEGSPFFIRNSGIRSDIADGESGGGQFRELPQQVFRDPQVYYPSGHGFFRENYWSRRP